jgi:putative aldouronate transport system permease protein
MRGRDRAPGGGSGLSDRFLAVLVPLTIVAMIGVMLYPFVYTISLSLSRPTAVIAGRVRLLPVGFTTSAYVHVLRKPGIVQGFLMSTFYVISGTGSLLVLSSFTAYPLSLKVFYPRNAVMFFVLFTMLFSGGMIPTFLWIRELRMLNTVWAIVLPSAMSAWYVIIYRTFLQEQPESIRESALIDGAGEFTILFRIVLPLSKPIIATLSVFHMVYHWNSFFPALLYLKSERLMPVQMILRRMLASATDFEEMLRAGAESVTLPISVQAAFVVVIVFPIVVVYPFAQRYFTKGVMVGALKG